MFVVVYIVDRLVIVISVVVVCIFFVSCVIFVVVDAVVVVVGAVIDIFDVGGVMIHVVGGWFGLVMGEGVVGVRVFGNKCKGMGESVGGAGVGVVAVAT